MNPKCVHFSSRPSTRNDHHHASHSPLHVIWKGLHAPLRNARLDYEESRDEHCVYIFVVVYTILDVPGTPFYLRVFNIH